MHKYSRTARSVTFAAIVGLSLGISAPGALAQSNTGGSNSGASTSASAALIDPTQTGSLTLHKKKDPESLGTPTGNADDQVKGEALDGAGFTIYKIKGVDLTTNEGLKNAAGLNVADYLSGEEADLSKVDKVGDEVITGAAGVAGQALFENLELGAYLVVETTTPTLAGVTFRKAQPFIAFIPMTQDNAGQGGTSWNYNPIAYPKNYSSKKPIKEVVDSGMNAGDTIVYTIKAYAQAVGAKQDRTKFVITDELDAKLTPPAADAVLVAGFTAGTDYTVTVTGNLVTITFTPAGLDKLANNQEVVATIPATVKDDTNGVVENTADVIENKPGTNQDKEPQTTDKVKTYYAGITFEKVEAGNTDNKLAGAEFRVYGVKNGQECSKSALDADLLDIAQINKADAIATSDSNGVVTFNGLHVNDWTDNSGQPNKYESYCLVETKSPADFELLAEPIEFTLTKAQSIQGDLVPINGGKIENLKDTTPELPMTGGFGVGILAAFGAAIIAAGAWLARRTSPKA
ncbi:SpaH/EbpB family LPXTG-anchored major pilin [Corynebacterium sp. ES2794-CONJ1]|uniref:SpaH/EbpB family LPXTG-anchored major pilin n=1 Tax=unclassified Corynebacterium TaxID=2624378 RepID=UPI00216886E1|nr:MULTISPECIES: SpaH/EbpB family LPXTG-anchored major pilin [unclassified Corynebacterium]MCS4489688.1 SpaH/EbpB family LPXTG-anchored major pilin [Corynebacterium sp. ES2775-CONJ]MCS4491303.1 SpaH/EbpB family LPXTG-anchored major pilin [Corynebacterium sp. ES2715-CONJ3]MCS4531600.1 SpaH/EbpB family LPXTG-anchored major pilin [Corynebacterium sp. ES2730-CONJ]MCU9518996.1 SpaH/EbpB family LPXTG-anchored major pilin [Corynebacterium sp. ES2794-CONJ1]